MSKRPPEMAELGKWGDFLAADEVVPAIRSLRVKLFEERTDFWALAALASEAGVVTRNLHGQVLSPSRMRIRAERFRQVARAIKEGWK